MRLQSGRRSTPLLQYIFSFIIHPPTIHFHATAICVALRPGAQSKGRVLESLLYPPFVAGLFSFYVVQEKTERQTAPNCVRLNFLPRQASLLSRSFWLIAPAFHMNGEVNEHNNACPLRVIIPFKNMTPSGYTKRDSSKMPRNNGCDGKYFIKHNHFVECYDYFVYRSFPPLRNI